MNTLSLHAPAGHADTRAGERNILVVALDAVVPTGVAGANAFVVAPALNSWLRRWTSDEDEARRRAEERATVVADLLALNSGQTEGRAGDADALLAIADALSSFAADEIVIAAKPGRPPRLVEKLASRARDRFALPTRLAGSSLLPRAA